MATCRPDVEDRGSSKPLDGSTRLTDVQRSAAAPEEPAAREDDLLSLGPMPRPLARALCRPSGQSTTRRRSLNWLCSEDDAQVTGGPRGEAVRREEGGHGPRRRSARAPTSGQERLAVRFQRAAAWKWATADAVETVSFPGAPAARGGPLDSPRAPRRTVVHLWSTGDRRGGAEGQDVGPSIPSTRP